MTREQFDNEVMFQASISLPAKVFGILIGKTLIEI